ncbi:hypothetical protein QC762_606800 [Podospora pseudocomata]|uniref:Uncharacterized protein n=1 Tax=Podospora pseudocomata TaxID=2093779 RepID=A0ABR0G8C0_9PEZI|nr:hypothetical protein QC762_606800 [Podospora pseudocomata]
MAQSALLEVRQIQNDKLTSEYRGKLSNQFVDELKCSTLFQADWSELISATPTALSLMGSLWVAAADPMAEKISMAKCMPTDGFRYMTKRAEPTLRSCLVDVCNNGGRAAFTKAGANMDALEINSRRICEERIPMVFKRLGPCTKGEEELEDFRDALDAFNKDAKRCAALATETREAFTKWGLMVGELNACTEAESGRASIQKDAIKIDEDVARVRAQFERIQEKTAVEEVKAAEVALKRAEKRLDTAIDKIPGPLENFVTGIVNGYVSAIPTIVSAAIPAIMASVSPVGAMTSAISSVKQGVGAVFPGGHAGAVPESAVTAPAVLRDPSYAAAIAIRDLVNHYYEYLGGETGEFDQSKFVEHEEAGAQGIPQGVSYFLGTLEGQQAQLESTNTAANKKMQAVFSTLIKVTKDIRTHLRECENGMSDARLPADSLRKWKKSVKKAQQDVLRLSVAGNTASSTNVPNPFANIKVNPVDTLAQTAQLNSAMQAVQLAQSAADAKQDAYDSALIKQARTAAMMVEIQQKLTRLQAQGRTLEEIKSVLRSCISILVDLTVQIAKIEQFFTMLSTVIDEIILVRAAEFTTEMGKAGRRAKVNGRLKVDDLSKQTIYAATLQLKGYFSVLQDISSMYNRVDKPHVRDGLDLCSELSKGAALGNGTMEMQDRLTRYMEGSGAAVARIVKDKQEELTRGLRRRIDQAAKTALEIETAISSHGLVVDQEAKHAIQAGAETAKEDAKKQIEAAMWAGERDSSEEIDGNDW